MRVLIQIEYQMHIRLVLKTILLLIANIFMLILMEEDVVKTAIT